MTDVKIGVKASLDASQIDAAQAKLIKQAEDFAVAVSKSSKIKIEPVSPKSLQDVLKLQEALKTLERVDKDLARRRRDSGQAGVGILDSDFSKMYPSAAQARRKQEQILSYLANSMGQNIVIPGEGGSSKGGGRGASVAAGVVQAGLNATGGATGGAGNVAANAVGAGMAGGFGAGMAGLLGGMLALGVGKLVGSALENITKAQSNDIAYDRLKRNLGDVNVQFNALKIGLQSAASNIDITFDEAEKLGSEFAKISGMRGSDYRTLGDEISTGVGVSRAFGLDPTQGVTSLAQMREVGATRSVNDSKRMALLIGETIGKAGPFAKAGEVMDAITAYTTQQTRQSMSAANTMGFTGMLSAMVASNGPGTDVKNSANIISRINAALTGGGAAGDASQFLTNIVGRNMGLGLFQTQMLREGGMFATTRGMFGKGSAYERYMGNSGGVNLNDKTFFQARMEAFNRSYGGNSRASKEAKAVAFARDTGIGIEQAMSILSVNPNQMGELERYVPNISNLSAVGIGNVTKAVTGSDSDRLALKSMFLGRSDVSEKEKVRLEDAFTKGTEEQKKILAELSASHDQERTQGKDLRDVATFTENLKTLAADQIVPTLLDMKMGIMYLAGGKDKKSSQEIMAAQAEADRKYAEGNIKGKWEGPINDATLAYSRGFPYKSTQDKTNARARIRDAVQARDDELNSTLTKMNLPQKSLKEQADELERNSQGVILDSHGNASHGSGLKVSVDDMTIFVKNSDGSIMSEKTVPLRVTQGAAIPNGKSTVTPLRGK